MRVIRSEVMGMCFGVRDALDVIDDVDQPEEVTIHGELVHNETVLRELDARGFRRTPENYRNGVPTTPKVLITAHGISQARRRQLTDAGVELLDTTCPLVRRVHDAAQAFARRGCHIVVVGKPGHVEVQGIVEDLESYDVIASPEDVRPWPYRRIGIVSQSTAPTALAEEIKAAVYENNPQAEILFEDTICQPTRARGMALDRLLDQIQVLVVVGGHNSNNTRQLVVRAEARNIPAHQVRGAEDLEPAWFLECDTAGLTAGTSTPDKTIDAVYRALRCL
jgi:4-hydroxy-3-methylbut-2-enyl diphosphate reductase